MIMEVRRKYGHYLPREDTSQKSWSMLLKRVIYIICFVWLCYLDHIIGSADGSVQFALKNYTGVVIGIIILTAYRIRDFLKLPYLVWCILFFIGRTLAMNWAENNVAEVGRFEAVIWNIGIYGIILIRLIYRWCIEGKKPRMKWGPFGLWIAMMIIMMLSRTDLTWTRSIFVFFGFFYLTEFKTKDLNNLFIGLADGIIIGFFIIQGYACMYRPYDVLRYEGMYTNPNINALFYLTAYTAVLCKWYQMKLMKRHKYVRLPIIVLSGVIFSLAFFTMGRTALISMALVTVLFIGFQVLSQKRGRLKIVMMDAGIIFASVIICFVPTYLAVRYIPAFVDEPLFFSEAMRYDEAKVHKGDAIDSEKYISLSEVLSSSFGRILWFMEEEETSETEPSKVKTISVSLIFPELKVHAADEENWYEDWDWSEFDEVYVEPGADKWHPILTDKEYETEPVKVRISIYKYYIEHLNWLGKRDGVDAVWISPNYSAPHAHNIFLAIAGDFGILVGAAFAITVFLTYHTVLFGLTDKKEGAWYYRLFVTIAFTTVTIAFGMLEICWIYGQLPFTLLFMMQYVVYHKKRKERRVRE